MARRWAREAGLLGKQEGREHLTFSARVSGVFQNGQRLLRLVCSAGPGQKMLAATNTRMHTNCAFGGSMSKPNVMLASVTMQWCERCVAKPARLFGSDGHGLFCPSGEWLTQGFRWLRLPHFGPTCRGLAMIAKDFTFMWIAVEESMGVRRVGLKGLRSAFWEMAFVG